MKISAIYSIENTVNGHRYIGSSVNIMYRWLRHRSELRKGIHNNDHLQRAWSMYGEDSFVFIIIEIIDPLTIVTREQFYIDTLKPEYNVNPLAYSPRGYRHTDTAKEKLRLSRYKPEVRDNHTRTMKGRKKPVGFGDHLRELWKTTEFREKILKRSSYKTEEHRKKISDAMKEYAKTRPSRGPHSAATKEKMRQKALARHARERGELN